MKHAKKIISLMLALVMVLSMSATAFAAEDYEYELYQIFTGDYTDGVLSNVKWGENGTGKTGESVPESVLEELTATNSLTDSEKLDHIKKYVDLESISMQVTPVKNNDGSVTYAGLAPGYYLVKDADGSIDSGENDAYTTYVVQVTDGTLTVVRKGEVPTVDKKIVEDDKEMDTNEASIGDTVSFRITGTLPSNIDDYKEYTYIFTDTLSKGLTCCEKNDVTVTVVNGDKSIPVTEYFYINVGEYNADNGTTLKIGIADLKALGKLSPAVKVDKNSKIVVTYTAVLNENAVIAGDGNENAVKLSYSNDPNNSGEGATTPPGPNPGEPTTPGGETPQQRTWTYTTKLTILKNDEKNKILTGAEFTLTGSGVNVVLVARDVFTEDENGEYWKLKNGTYTQTAPVITGGDDDNSDLYDSTMAKYSKGTEITSKGTGKTETDVTGAVDGLGYVTFSGLGAGEYTITETKTPSGYNTIAPVQFKLSFDVADKKFSSDNEKIVVGADNMLATTIVNHSGSTLPSTGGMGTGIFYILGTILVLGAGVLLIVRRRMNVKK